MDELGDQSVEVDVEAASLMEEVLSDFKGPNALNSALSKPKKIKTFVNALKKFRTDNAIEVETLDCALNLLDIHNYPRSSFNRQATGDLGALLLSRIQELVYEGANNPFIVEKLEDFLKKIFGLYPLKMIRPLIIEILQHLNSIPNEYVDVIASNQDLYSECSTPILRHVWRKHYHLFYKDMLPVLKSYYRTKYWDLFSVEPSKTNYFTSSIARERRQIPEVQKLMEMVGNDFKLYKHLLHWVRMSYEETGDFILCTLRSELIMTAHDAGMEKFARQDPCHELSWCLDVCMRDKGLDSNHSAKIKAILDVCCTLDPLIVGDLAMVCADPHVIHFLCGFIVRKLKDSATSVLPRDVSSINLAVRLLSFGLHAEKIVKTKVVPPSMVDSIFFTQFLTALSGCILEDHIFTEDIKDPETLESLPIGPVPEIITKFLKVDPMAALIYLHFVIDLLPVKGRLFNKSLMDRYSHQLVILRGHIAIEGIWGYLFTERVIAATTKMQFLIDDQHWQKLIMEDLMFSRITESNDPLIRMSHMRLVYIIGYCWGVEPCREMFCKYNMLPLESFSTPSLAREAYAIAHQKVVDCLWPKPQKPMPLPEATCANGHEHCIYQCPVHFIYGDSPDYSHRLDEYLQGFDDPAYLRVVGHTKYEIDDDTENYFHLVAPE